MRVLLAPVLVLALLVPGAAAHAVLQSSTPAPNAHVDAGLTRVDVVFTEDVERQYTSAHLEDASGEVLSNVSFSFDASRGNVVHLGFPPLRDGIYSVFWQALSVDSHTTQGAFIFAVGAATIRFPSDPSVTSPQQDVLPEGVARAVYYVGLFLVLGTPIFLVAVSRERALPARPLATAALFGALGAAAALLGLLHLASRASIALATASATGAGLSFLWRAGLLGAASVALFVAFFSARLRSPLAWLAVALALGALVATSLGSHAAADKSLADLSVGVDALHLLMGAVWIGGVVAFAHVAWGREAREVGALVERFTPIAIGSVVLLLATGTYASWRHIPAWSDLWETPYGRIVSLKVLLLGVLVLFGAYNKEVLGPRLKRGDASATYFRRTLQLEAVVMVSVLLAAGVLASSAPPDQGVASGFDVGGSPYFHRENLTRYSHVILDLRPNPPVVGIQNLTIAVHPLTRVPINDNTSVFLKVAQPGQKEPSDFYDPGPTRVTNDTWTLQGSLFSSPGTWRLYVELQRTDVGESTKLVYDITVQAPKSSP